MQNKGHCNAKQGTLQCKMMHFATPKPQTLKSKSCQATMLCTLPAPIVQGRHCSLFTSREQKYQVCPPSPGALSQLSHCKSKDASGRRRRLWQRETQISQKPERSWRDAQLLLQPEPCLSKPSALCSQARSSKEPSAHVIFLLFLCILFCFVLFLQAPSQNSQLQPDFGCSFQAKGREACKHQGAFFLSLVQHPDYCSAKRNGSLARSNTLPWGLIPS